MTQLQGNIKDGSTTITVRLDPASYEYLKEIRRFTEEDLKLKSSDGVILRRLLAIGWARAKKQVNSCRKLEKKSEGKGREKLSNWMKRERNLLRLAAGRFDFVGQEFSEDTVRGIILSIDPDANV